jgi:hypothetical protein
MGWQDGGRPPPKVKANNLKLKVILSFLSLKDMTKENLESLNILKLTSI